MLTRTILLAFVAVAGAFANTGRQATRDEVTLRNFRRRASALLPRSSALACPSGQEADSQGTCCSGSVTIIGSSGATCCSEKVYNEVWCSDGICCNQRQRIVLLDWCNLEQAILYFVTGAPTESYFTETTCCAEGTVAVDDDSVNARCQNVQRKRDQLAFDLATRPVKRGVQDDPLRQLSFREGTWRAQLSPHLLADLLVNDWQFDYRGKTFIDFEARQSAGSGWQNQLMKRMPHFVKRRGSLLVGDYIARSVARGEEYIPIPITRDYEIHVDDIPELYMAIKTHPNFQGSFHVNGAEWDLNLIRATISRHPSFNATIHDV